MFTTKFGIEIEFTGITRFNARRVLDEYFQETVTHWGDGSSWQIKRDGSILCQRKSGVRTVAASDEYSVELISPVLLYENDMETLQNIVRNLRKAGAFVNGTCGIHIHLDGADHTVRSIRNFINIIAAHNYLFYKALEVPPTRMRYCKALDDYFVRRMNEVKPKTMKQIEEIWYEKFPRDRYNHYHESRYHFLNLHSFFHGNNTVELRGFNSTLHAGKVRAYIVLALALNHQAITLKYASPKRVQEENEKFAMRVYLNRIGFIGPEFKNCRAHLYEHLAGNAAWRYGSKEACRSRKRSDGNNHPRDQPITPPEEVTNANTDSTEDYSYVPFN